MEDLIHECEIEEESDYYDEHSQQVDYSSGKESSILNKGWGIGKKLLVTGAVISSAPFALPPLVVTSALAFACWVPCGVVMASYSCSEKIMSKLLPCEEKFEDAEEGEKSDDGEYLDMEEMLQSEENHGERMEGSRFGYNNDVLLDEEGKEFGVSPIEVTSVVFEGSEGQEKLSDLAEGEELVKETTGLLEKIRDEGNACNGMEMENHYSDGTPGSRKDFTDMLVDNNVSNIIEGEDEIIFDEPEENDYMVDEELVNETRGLLEKIRDGGSADSDAVAITDEMTKRSFRKIDRGVDERLTCTDVGLDITNGTMEGEFLKGREIFDEKTYVTRTNAVFKDWGGVSESRSPNNNYKGEGHIGEIMIDTTIRSTVEETNARARNKKKLPQAERAENNISQVKALSINEKEILVFTDADVREIADESGLHLFDENNTSAEQGTDTFGYSTSICEGEVDTLSILVMWMEKVKISSRKVNVHSNGVLKNEDKIWKQIESIRSIVGYEVTPRASYMEELKALYIFTGVEPPASFDDPTDHAQVDHKLRFLMSIIGLK